MEDFRRGDQRGSCNEVKIVLTSVVAALAIYQVLLMFVGWEWVRLKFLNPKAASFTHRSAGDAARPPGAQDRRRAMVEGTPALPAGLRLRRPGAVPGDLVEFLRRLPVRRVT
ncbi:MAG: hypothetical protein M3N24_01130 [Actinomycetota bacterium]|nr:hypothetical protein [Actinomycetota bacterium]